MNEEIKAVVIGGIHHNTLGVIRSLGENNIPANNIKVILVDEHYKKKNIISSCKYIKKENIIYVRKNDECVNALISFANDKKQTVICCSDGTAETVISHSDELEQWYNLPSTKLNIRDCMSKELQSEIAAQCGFYLPQSSVFSKQDNVVWNKFPCIIKPLKSVLGGGKADIKISNNLEELKVNLENISSETVQIQEYINKQMEFQLIGCSLDAGKEVIIPGYTTIIRQPDNTNTGYLKYSPIKDLSFDIEGAKKYLKKIGYSGLFSLEFIRNHNDDYFLEINLRNDGNAYCVKTAGVNLPYIWIYYQTFHELPNCSKSFEKTVYFMPDWNDLRRGVKAVGLMGWLKQSKQAESHAVFNKNDIKPFITQSLDMFGVCINYLKRKF